MGERPKAEGQSNFLAQSGQNERMTGSERLSKTDFLGRKPESQFEEEKSWEGHHFVT
jgi:hypothetical protein